MSSIDIAFVGYLGQDPTLRFTAAGTAVTELRIAVNRRTQRAGEWVDAPTTWLTVAVFGQLASNVAESLHRGDPVSVRGELVSEEWKPAAGSEPRVTLKVLASEVGVPLGSHVVDRLRRTSRRSENAGGPEK